MFKKLTQLTKKNIVNQKSLKYAFSSSPSNLEIDPLDVHISDPTLRHYGKLTAVKFEISDLKLQSTKMQHYINSYRKYGHYYADIDPLNKLNRLPEFVNPLEFDLTYQTKVEDLDLNQTHLSNLAEDVTQLEEQLQKIYTGSVGIEFDHIVDKKMKNWLYRKYEEYMSQPLSDSEKRNIHGLLVQTEAFDHFLHKKFNTFKRYAGEGVESSITALKTLLAKASELDVEEAVIGIPHRGRLNVLCNVLDFPAQHLFKKVFGYSDMPQEFYNNIDDVISHIAISKTKKFIGTGCNEKPITVSMMHNPSHLELINPSTMGKVRAKQDEYQDKKKVLNIQFHGDAAFTAQGVVYENFALSGVPKFSIGGTVHVIINNQIGYTTSVKDSRGHFYCSDLGKTYQYPIVHVNSDDPEAIHKVMKFAVDFRQQFGKDIIIDLIGYRKYGHNELDEPEFTQPLYYKQIRKIQKTLPELYNEKLVAEKLIKEDQFTKLRERVFSHLDKEFDKVKKEHGRPFEEYTKENAPGQSAFTKKWKNLNFSTKGTNDDAIITGLNASMLRNVAKETVCLPAEFNVHHRLQKYFINARLQQIKDNNVDWATAEAMAISTLLQQSYNVRLTGEDVERGTFSQRHWVFVDQKTEEEWNPIKNFSEAKNTGSLYVCNSPLSESAVLSYEYGYSLENPDNLSMWEAQFGDFFNCAQTTFDTLMTCSEEKWARQSSLVTILPHGLDGAGPEHSSCRIERFLQLGNTDGINRHLQLQPHNPNRTPDSISSLEFHSSAQDVNFCFVQPTTPANYFHVLRRQMLRDYRKPLVISGPKILLRHPECRSSFEEMGETTKFLPVIQKHDINENTKTIITCSGKYCYSIFKFLKENNIENVSVLVLEELLPFPEQILQNLIGQSNAENTQVLWMQEEHMNQGAYSFALPHLQRILQNLNFKNQEIKYVGRKSSSVPAIGSPQFHKSQASEIFEYLQSLL